MRILFLIAVPLLLGACGKKAEDAPEKAAAPAEPVMTLAQAIESVAFVCDKDLPITAIYGTNLEGQPDVVLIIQGRNYNLVQTTAPSGLRFAGAGGLQPGMGLVWWVQGETALLQHVPVDRLADLAAPQTIKTCKAKPEP
ncbi:MAG: MliC family protein [Sandarakinorhabdus sp.]|nr:MliC family protein [Sandarakinorhabdus sp.]